MKARMLTLSFSHILLVAFETSHVRCHVCSTT